MKPIGIAGDILDMMEAQLNGSVRTSPGTKVPIYERREELVFKGEGLLYDIKNLAFVEGDVMPTDDEHDRHAVMDIGEDGNIDRVRRVVELALAKCRELLFPYTKEGDPTASEREGEGTSAEDSQEATLPDYVIVMFVPKDFSKTTVDYLEKMIREYVTCRVMADWMSITNLRNNGSAVNWQGRLKELEDEIDSAVHARMRRVRRTQSPF